jgi:hypothetical protein
VNELRIYESNEPSIAPGDITVRIDGVEAERLATELPRTQRFAIVRPTSSVATIEITLADSDSFRHVIEVVSVDPTVHCTICAL